ncbi:MAG: phosphoglucomutase/phosphomannomutase family protein [Deltaproteobacteria bacterium]|nr:phosphoglucomutase/phosphomannomutase family protein [Deltaproteobacteria bacterium]
MNKIKFGTSGWRGIIAEDFTFENVRIVTQAIADYLKDTKESEKGVVVGYDSRFLGERFAREAVSILLGNGIKSYLTKGPTPTPVISLEILRRKAGGAINFTASHNPPEYNGLKFSSSWGGPALPQTTKDIEKRANEMLGEITYRELSIEDAIVQGWVEEIDPLPFYLEHIEKKIDMSCIKKAGLKIVADPLYGAGMGYLDKALESAGCNLKIIHNQRDPSFGGKAPDPSEKNISELIDIVKSGGYNLGLATDGDADRFGIVDANGRFIEPNYIIALLLDYLVRVKGMKGGVARSVATTHLIDAVAEKHNINVYETPVGFKYIGELIREDKIIIGGEESAGLTIKGHVPEKDGILACLLVAEMVAREGKTITELLEDLYKKVGRYVTARENIKIDMVSMGSLFGKIKEPSKKALAGLGLDVNDIRIMGGGIRISLANGSWLLMRESGTEPIVRLYSEARDEEELELIIMAGREFIAIQNSPVGELYSEGRQK